MHEIAMLFAQVASVVVAMVAALAAIGIATRALWRLTSRVRPREAPTVSPAHLERLEGAVEAIAIEVERISEAQRYTVALLSERSPMADAERGEVRVALPAARPATTPR